MYIINKSSFKKKNGFQPAGVSCDVVCEDDGPHRSLAGAGLAHQQDLLLHPDSSKVISSLAHKKYLSYKEMRQL